MNHCIVLKIGRIALLVLLTFSASVIAVVAQAQQGQQIYVCNQGAATLSIIDVASLEIVSKIDLQDLGFSSNAKPHHTLAEPDGSFWYVTLIGENRVLKFNRQNELVGQTEMEVPGLISLHPTEDILLVGRSMSAVNPPQSVGVIQRSDMQLTKEIPTFFARPHALAIQPEGKWAYIASLAENQIMSFDPETEANSLTTFGGTSHVYVDFAISPNGKQMVVTGQVSGQLLVFDLQKSGELVLSDSIAVNAQPWHPVYSPDGQYVYFGNKGAHTVTVVDMQTGEVKKVIEGRGLAQPHGTALSADGKYLFVSNNNRKGTYQSEKAMPDSSPPGTITVISTETFTIEKVIEVDAYPSGIGTRARAGY